MDIGAEISKKIQMAITAKLKELNAYVDDELPDYIMIMVANKKTEAQMTDALSLFLSDNTKIFTAWLHNLLATLRRSKSEKKGSKQMPEVRTKTPTVPERDCREPNDPDLSKQQKTSKLHENADPGTKELRKPEQQSKSSTISEAVITINPEVDDILNDELLTDVNALETSTKVLHKNETEDKKTQPSAANKNDQHLDKYQEEKADSKRKKDTDKSGRKRKSDHKQPQRPEKEAEDKKQRITEEKPSSRKQRTTKTKKPGTSSTKMRKEGTEIREWDRGKFGDPNEKISPARDRKRRETAEWQDNGRGAFYDEDVDDARPKSSISSAVNQVTQNSEFVSESESDDDYKISRVNSKVAYPKRKIRVPPEKQANKALLMKAMSEAEKSVSRKRPAGPKAKEVSQPTEVDVEWIEKPTRSKSRSGKTKESKKNFVIQRVVDRHAEDNTAPKKRKEKLIVVRKTGANARNRGRSAGVVQAKQKVILLEDEDPVTVIRVRRKSSVEKTEDVVYVEGYSEEETMSLATARDKRNFVSRDTALKKDYDFATVKFDSRRTKRLSDNSSENQIAVTKTKQRITAKVPPRPQSPLPPSECDRQNFNQKPEPQGPKFIVTLDGIVSTKHITSNAKDLDQGEIPNSKAKQFKFEPVTAPVAPKIPVKPRPVTAPRIPVKPPPRNPPPPTQKPLVIEATDGEEEHEEMTSHLTSTELGKMREKLLQVQEEAAKLKRMQAKLAAAQAEQNAILKSGNVGNAENTEGEQRSIYVGNVHFSTSEKQLSDYFSICGGVARVTILKDAFTGHPKGFAYLEFDDKRAVSSALALDNTRLNNRVIRVTLKQSKPSAPFKSIPQRYRASRFYSTSTTRRLYRGSRFRQSTVGFSTRAKLPSRNKTWVNPSIAEANK